MEGAETAASLTYALSDMLHRSLGESDSVVTISDELNYIKDYLHIQQTRFPGRFTVDVQVSPDVETVKIPAMMLIILVENAILHGFRNIRWPGKLVIHCGGCMLNEKEVDSRRQKAENAGVPFTNYGIAISYMRGIFNGSLFVNKI